MLCVRSVYNSQRQDGRRLKGLGRADGSTQARLLLKVLVLTELLLMALVTAELLLEVLVTVVTVKLTLEVFVTVEPRLEGHSTTFLLLEVLVPSCSKYDCDGKAWTRM